MRTLFLWVLVIHFVGLAGLLGGFLVQWKDAVAAKARVTWAILWGAVVMLVTGVAMVGLIQALPFDADYPKYIVKAALTVLITVLAIVYRKKDPPPAWAMWSIGGLALLTTILATVWR